MADGTSNRYGHPSGTNAARMAPFADIVVCLEALLPDGQRKVRAEPKTTLIYLGEYATGWPFTHPYQVWRWLIPARGGY